MKWFPYQLKIKVRASHYRLEKCQIAAVRNSFCSVMKVLVERYCERVITTAAVFVDFQPRKAFELRIGCSSQMKYCWDRSLSNQSCVLRGLGIDACNDDPILEGINCWSKLLPQPSVVA